MGSAFSGSFEEIGKIIKTILILLGPTSMIYYFFSSMKLPLELILQYIVDYLFFVAILYIFIVLRNIDKKIQ